MESKSSDSEQIQIKLNLAQSDSELRAIYDGLLDGLLVADAETKQFVKTNQAMCRMLGYTAQELLSLSVEDMHTPDILGKIFEIFEEAARGMRKTAEDIPMLRKNGEILIVDIGIGMLNYQGRSCLAGLFHDNTDRKKAEESLREKEQFMQMALSVSNSYSYNWDIKGDRIWRSSSAGEILGISGDRATRSSSREFFQRVHPDDRDMLREGLQNLKPSPDSFKLQYRLQKQDDQTRVLEETARGIFGEDGTLLRIVGITTDITERIQAEEILNRSRIDLDRAQQVGNMGSWRLNTVENVLEWSDETYRIFGIPKGTTLTYESFLDTVHPEDRDHVDSRWKAALLGEPYDLEHRIKAKDEIKWVREKAYLELDSSNRLLGGFGIVQDITERKRMEDILQRSHEELELRVQERTRELVAAVKKQDEYSRQLRRMSDELARTEQRERQRLSLVLHDGLQQHLVAALYQLELARETRGAGSELDQLRTLLNESVEMARRLAAELSPPVLLRSDLRAALKWLLGSKMDKYGLEATLEAAEDIPNLKEETVLALFEIARELLFNVVKHSGVKEVLVQLDHKGENVALTVTDHGRGFESDKARSEGLGLFYISERISLLGGKVHIESKPGKGCKISVILPHSPESSRTSGSEQMGLPAGKTDRPQKGEAKTRIRILLADDHISVRQGMADLMNREPDFEVVGEASNGKQAVEMSRKMRPDVILMDVNMPEMDGIEATRIIHNENSDICVIGFSMHEESSLKKALLEAGAIAYFSKQGSSKDLKHAIRACCRGELRVPPRRKQTEPQS